MRRSLLVAAVLCLAGFSAAAHVKWRITTPRRVSMTPLAASPIPSSGENCGRISSSDASRTGSWFGLVMVMLPGE